MNNLIHPEKFEEKMEGAANFGIPSPTPTQLTSIENSIFNIAWPVRPVKTRFRKPIWTVLLALVMLAMIVTLAFGPQNMLAAIQGAIGYFPGIGFVDDPLSARVLDSPVSVEREGITFTIESVYSYDGRVILIYYVEPWIDAEWKHEAAQRLRDSGLTEFELYKLGLFSVYLVDPSGNKYPDNISLESVFDERGIPTMRIKLTFESLPAGIDEYVLQLPRIPDTLPGMAPENWEIPFTLRLAQPGEIQPAFEIVTATNPSPDSESPGTDDQQEPIDTSLLAEGVHLSLGGIIQSEQTIKIQATLYWEDPEIADVSFFDPHRNPGLEDRDLRPVLIDANGVEIPLDINYEESVLRSTSEDDPIITYVLFAEDVDLASLQSPFRLSVPGFVLSRFAEQGQGLNAYPAFTIDPSRPLEPGNCVELDENVLVRGQTITMESVCLHTAEGGIPTIQGGGGGGGPSQNLEITHALILEVSQNNPEVFGFILADAACQLKENYCVTWGTNGSKIRAQYHGEPEFPVTYIFTSIGYIVTGPWEFEFDISSSDQ